MTRVISTILAGMAATAMLLGAAQARNFDRSVPSGRTVSMYRYHSWNKDCQANGGVVKVVIKPSHGTLTPRKVASQIRKSRFHGTSPCEGMPLTGFEVDYRSAPGFHGTDSFTIEVTFGNGRSDVDQFTVQVR